MEGHGKSHGSEVPRYKLTYFNFRGLAEGARLLFHYADVPFEDNRIEREKWPEMKPSTPFGQLPLLEVDGHVIAQSAAIYRFLGKQFGLVPKCPFQEAIVDSVYDAHKDFTAEIKPFFVVAAGFEKGDKEKLKNEVYLPARDKYFGYLKKFLEKSEGDYLVGREVTWVDIVIADILATYGGFVAETFDGFPEIKKFIDHVRSLPKIEKWIAERPKTDF